MKEGREGGRKRGGREDSNIIGECFEPRLPSCFERTTPAEGNRRMFSLEFTWHLCYHLANTYEPIFYMYAVTWRIHVN